MLFQDDPALGVNNRPGQDILQLPHIAGGLVFHEALHRPLFDSRGLYVQVAIDFSEEVLDLAGWGFIIWSRLQTLKAKGEASIEAEAVGIIKKAAEKGDWKAALAYLERRYPEHWAPKTTVELKPTRKASAKATGKATRKPSAKPKKRPSARVSKGKQWVN